MKKNKQTSRSQQGIKKILIGTVFISSGFLVIHNVSANSIECSEINFKKNSTNPFDLELIADNSQLTINYDQKSTGKDGKLPIMVKWTPELSAEVPQVTPLNSELSFDFETTDGVGKHYSSAESLEQTIDQIPLNQLELGKITKNISNLKLKINNDPEEIHANIPYRGTLTWTVDFGAEINEAEKKPLEIQKAGEIDLPEVKLRNPESYLIYFRKIAKVMKTAIGRTPSDEKVAGNIWTGYVNDWNRQDASTAQTLLTNKVKELNDRKGIRISYSKIFDAFMRGFEHKIIELATGSDKQVQQACRLAVWGYMILGEEYFNIKEFFDLKRVKKLTKPIPIYDIFVNIGVGDQVGKLDSGATRGDSANNIIRPTVQIPAQNLLALALKQREYIVKNNFNVGINEVEGGKLVKTEEEKDGDVGIRIEDKERQTEVSIWDDEKKEWTKLTDPMTLETYQEVPPSGLAKWNPFKAVPAETTAEPEATPAPEQPDVKKAPAGRKTVRTPAKHPVAPARRDGRKAPAVIPARQADKGGESTVKKAPVGRKAVETPVVIGRKSDK